MAWTILLPLKTMFGMITSLHILVRTSGPSNRYLYWARSATVAKKWEALLTSWKWQQYLSSTWLTHLEKREKIKSGHNCFTAHPESPRSACVVAHHSTWNVQCSNKLLDSTTEQQRSNDTVIHYAICYVPYLCHQQTSFTLEARK